MMMKIVSDGQEISFVRSFPEERNQSFIQASKQASNGRLFKHVLDSIRVALMDASTRVDAVVWCSKKKRRTTEDCLRRDSFSFSKQQLLRPPVAQRINLEDERFTQQFLCVCAEEATNDNHGGAAAKVPFPSSSMSYSFRRPRLP